MEDKSAWGLDANHYRFINVVGSGSFSKVYRAEKLHDKTQVAIKVMDLDNVSTSFEDILQEVQTMKLSENPNILQCYCSFVESNQLWLVMQMMDLGSALRVMTRSKALGLGVGLNEEWVAYILGEALNGLSYLHSNGQIHRDVKSGNILVHSDGSIRVADFGVSGWTVARGLRQDTVKTFVGTPCYMAPEVMEQLQGYDSKADIWSVGITTLELAKGVAPYAHHSPMRVLVLTIEEEPPSLKCYRDGALQRTGEPFSSSFEDFYKRCLQKNPRSRPSADELLRHKFLKSHLSGRASFFSQLLNLIPSVGSEITTSDGRVVAESEEREVLPGESSVAVTVERWNFDSSDGPNSRKAHNSREPKDALLNLPGTTVAASSSSKYAKGTTWVFDGDDIDDWKASALGEETEALKSCSGIVARKSGSFTSPHTDESTPSSEFSQYRITVQDVRKSRGSSGLNPVKESLTKNSTRNEPNEPIDDFLREFENEIVLEKTGATTSTTVPSAPVVVPVVATAANVPSVGVSQSGANESNEKDFSTASFMDELEDILDGCG